MLEQPATRFGHDVPSLWSTFRWQFAPRSQAPWVGETVQKQTAVQLVGRIGAGLQSTLSKL